MTTSQNGWSIDPPTERVTVEECTATLRAGDVAVVLAWVAQQWNDRVEPLTTWYGYRSAAANTATGTPVTNSNHRSATASDHNGASHPYEYARLKSGRRWSATITGDKRDAVHQIIAEADGVLRWGGDYQSPYRDEMHVEIIAGAKRVAALASRIRAAQQGITQVLAAAPVIPTRTTQEVEDMLLIADRFYTDYLDRPARVSELASIAGTLEDHPEWSGQQLLDTLLDQPGGEESVRAAYHAILGPDRAPESAQVLATWVTGPDGKPRTHRQIWDGMRAQKAAGAK